MFGTLMFLIILNNLKNWLTGCKNIKLFDRETLKNGKQTKTITNITLVG